MIVTKRLKEMIWTSVAGKNRASPILKAMMHDINLISITVISFNIYTSHLYIVLQ